MEQQETMAIKQAVSNFLEGKKRPATSVRKVDPEALSPQSSFAKTGAGSIRPSSPFSTGLLRAPVNQARLRVENGRVQVRKPFDQIPHGALN